MSLETGTTGMGPMAGAERPNAQPMSAAAMAEQPRDLGEVRALVQECIGEAERLAVDVDGLRMLLNPVLTNRPVGEQTGEKDRAAESAVGQDLHLLLMRLRATHEAINDTAQRLVL